MLQLHIQMVLFGKNIVSNISTKASKKHHFYCPISNYCCEQGADLMQIYLTVKYSNQN